MKKLFNSAALVCGFLFLAATAAAQYSTPVRDVENPARSSAYGSCTMYIFVYNETSGQCSTDFPAAIGKTFVLNTVSFRCTSNDPAVRFANVLMDFSTPTSQRLTLPIGAANVVSEMYQDGLASGLGIVVKGASANAAPGIQFRADKTSNGAGSCAVYFFGSIL